MGLRITFTLLLAGIAIASSDPTAAAPDPGGGCSASMSDSWLVPNPPGVEALAFTDTSKPVGVNRNLAEAMLRLAEQSFVPLSEGDVRFFLREEPPPSVKSGGKRPYLVRAVFSIPNPTIGGEWGGQDLFISTFGLGCYPYTKHPVLVYLERVPRRVYVSAMAAL